MRFSAFGAVISLCVFSSAGHASPPPAFECLGVTDAVKSEQSITGVGDFLFALDDERYGLTPYPEGIDDVLQLQAASGEGAVFTGTRLRFFEASKESGLQSNIQLIATGQVFDCQSLIISTNLPQAGDEGFVRGRSLGSIVRTGPSVNATTTEIYEGGKLEAGEFIVIFRDEGKSYNGFPWFQIEYGEGFQGFVWGGTLCSEGVDLPGVSARCEAISFQ